MNPLVRTVLSNTNMQDVLLKPQQAIAQPHLFSHKVAMEGVVTNQKASGRCWLFATANILRFGLIQSQNLNADFELSQSYLFFWDKLEKSNYFLENILETLEEPTESRLIQHLFMAPLNDGGQFDMAANLVKKYGCVPKSVFPETFHSSNSANLDWLLTMKLREYGADLRRMKHQEGVSVSECKQTKTQMLCHIFSILVNLIGKPPTSFCWEYA